jgi:hypothetical protein
MFKKPEDISPLPAGMVDAFTKSLNSQLGNYDVAQEAPAPEAPTAEADIPEQQVEEGVKAEGNAFTKALTAAKENGDDEFVVAGKKYKVEDYIKEDEDEDEDDEEDKDEDEDEEELEEDNTNDKSDDGDGLDKVQPKAVKKKFKDRKDKDIDNDGDVDDSDKYLHKRRKAVSKALESIDGRTKAFKEKVSKLAYAKEETEELDENRNLLKDYEELKKKGKSDSQAQDVLLSMPQYKRYDSSKLGKVIGDALRKGTISKKAPFKLAEESGDLGKPEGFFSEEMDPTDHVRFNKETNMFCVYDKDGKKVYESEKEEEANAYAIDNHDALMGKGELAEVLPPHLAKLFDKEGNFKDKKKQQVFNKMMGDGIGKEIAKDMGRIKYSVDADEKKKKVFVKVDRNDVADASKALKKHPAYISGAMRVVAESVELDESKSATGYDLYHKDFSGAMQHAYAFAKKKGFVVDKNDIDDKVATGPKKPSKGKTNSYILKTNKKKNVHIQVANLDNKRYELNMYIESVELEEAPITGIQGKDRKTYALELDKSGRKVMVRTKNQFGDIKTISLKQAAKLFEASDLEKLEERKIDPADQDDMVATKGDKESAKMNIIVQLRKAADVKGNLDIVFADGKKQKLPANIIKIALDKYNSFRKPATKKKLIDGMTKSYRSMLQTLKTIKEYSEETESKES